MVHPLLPIAHDWWEHEFNETEHLSHVHSHMGKDHLEKELKNCNSENTTNKDQNSLKADDQVPFHLSITECAYNFCSISIHNFYPILKPNNLTEIFIARQSPPPKFS